MELFSGEGNAPLEKDIPPDKTAGPWLSRKSTSTGREHVGKSPRRGTNEEHQSLNVQGNLHEHSDVFSQVATPTEERPGTFLLPRPGPVPLRDATGPKEVLNFQSCMQLFDEFYLAQEMFLTCTPCALEIFRKYGEKVVLCALECSFSLIVNLEGFNELVPHLRGEMTRMLKTIIEPFLRRTESDPMILAALKKTATYQMLLIKSEDMKDIPPVKPVKPAPRLSFGGLTVIRWKDQTIGGQTIPEDTFSLGGALPGTKVIHVPPVKPLPSFSFGG